MRLAATSAVLAFGLATAAFAVGSGDDTPPEPTETTETCENGKVWDEDKGECVAPEKSSLDTDALYDAVRELAHAGRYRDAQRVLAAMPDQTDDRVLTYLGFTTRKLGDVARGMAYYREAIARNPDNLLARSYMGQAYAEAGRMTAAGTQLAEIRVRGGAGGWPERALARAIRTGRGFSY